MTDFFLFYDLFLLFLLFNKNIGLLNNNITNLSNIAVIPFKTFYPPVNLNGRRPFGAKDFFNSIHYSSSYLELEAGNNNSQKLSLFFEFDNYYFSIDDKYFKDEIINNLLCHYSSSLSNSYGTDKSKTLYAENNKKYIFARDYFKIYSDIYLKNYDLCKLNFYHSLDNYKNISNTCGKIGLLYASEYLYNSLAEVNFINQIHKNFENVDISWIFQYNSNNEKDNEGLFIMGIESLEKNNNKNELISIYSKLTECGNVLEWNFPIDELYIGNFYYEIEDEEIKIDPNIEGFEIPKIFSDKLMEIYFNKYIYKNICETEIATEFYTVISCHKDKFNENDINNFPDINFYKFKIGFNFTFSGKELFFQKDNKSFFRMITNLKSNEKDYKFGRLFLKKYKIIFNSESKSMSFYKNNNKKNVKEKNNVKVKKNKSVINVITYFIIGFLFLGLGFFLGRKYFFIDKKRLANELEDDNYEYKSRNDDIKKEEKLIEMS